jgi:hypothetical protein
MPGELTIVLGKRKILWEPEVEPAPSPSVITVDHQPDIIAVSDNSQVLIEGKRAYKKRMGNGHKSEKKRDLRDSERNLIKNFLFIPKNGQIDNDDCVVFKNMIKDELDDIAIFQVTGFVSVLHTDVASGSLMVNDLVAYESRMRTKYGGTLWARYNLPLYVKTRAINASLISQGLPPIKAIKGKALGHTIVTEALQELKAADPTVIPVVNTQGETVGIQGVSTTPKFTSFRKRFAGA